MAATNSYDILKQTNDKKANAGPLSLFQSARNTILQATGIDQNKDVLKDLNLPKSLVQYLTKAFGTEDFFVNKDNVTPEDVESGIYKAVCRLDNRAVILKVIEKKDISKERYESLNKWEHLSISGIQKCYASFLQQEKMVYVLEYMRRADDVIRKVREQKSALSEGCIWHMVHEISQIILTLAENECAYKELKTSKIGFANTGEVQLENDITSLSEDASAMDNLIMDDDQPSGVYTSPEVINGEDATEASLIWQLGVVIYELAALKPAYIIEDASNVFEALNEISEGNLPSELSGSFSDELKKLIFQCMAVNPSDRPAVSELKLISSKHATNTAADELKEVL